MIFYVIAVLITLVWWTAFILFNDLTLPDADLMKYKSILLVFAHFDDETVLAGGLMARAIMMGKTVRLMTLTRGDKGNSGRKSDPVLAKERRRELDRVLSMFGVENVISLDYEDDTLSGREREIAAEVEKAITKAHPDLVITFDEHGWYGHADHIACYEAVRSAVAKRKTPEVWYAVRPEAVNRAARLIAALSGRRGTASKRTKPQYKLFIGGQLLRKIKAVYAYKSQSLALRQGVTLGPIPMWLFLSAQPYEYFAVK